MKRGIAALEEDTDKCKAKQCKANDKDKTMRMTKTLKNTNIMAVTNTMTKTKTMI